MYIYIYIYIYIYLCKQQHESKVVMKDGQTNDVY